MSTSELTVIENGSITSVPGFEAAGVAAGLKPNGALDVALVRSTAPCSIAAVFTTNAFKAAPVLYDQRILAEYPEGLRAVVINAGCANACTGERGLRDAKATAEAVAASVGCGPQNVMVMSTGVIGAPLPMDKLVPGIVVAAQQLKATEEAGHTAARAIMTTDTRPKEVAVQMRVGDSTFRVAGMVKGAGMIHPNMATMLCLITSDAAIAPALAQQALTDAVERSFHLMTVDGDTSTNDTVLVMANGTAAMTPIASAASPEYAAFARGLEYVATELAKAVARDGEGATRFIEITVRGARSREQAKQVGMSVARSSLVKTAIYGQDANWGRIACAVGYSGAGVEADKVGVWLGDLELGRAGAAFDINEARASAILAQSDIPITIDLGQGDASVTVWTCDLSHEYVSVNAHYRT